jgi:hypothetical protein
VSYFIYCPWTFTAPWAAIDGSRVGKCRRVIRPRGRFNQTTSEATPAVRFARLPPETPTFAQCPRLTVWFRTVTGDFFSPPSIGQIDV